MITLNKCRFKRTENSPMEYGLIINEDFIIDNTGKIVCDSLWNYEILHHDFSIKLDLNNN